MLPRQAGYGDSSQWLSTHTNTLSLQMGGSLNRRSALMAMQSMLLDACSCRQDAYMARVPAHCIFARPPSAVSLHRAETHRSPGAVLLLGVMRGRRCSCGRRACAAARPHHEALLPPRPHAATQTRPAAASHQHPAPLGAALLPRRPGSLRAPPPPQPPSHAPALAGASAPESVGPKGCG